MYLINEDGKTTEKERKLDQYLQNKIEALLEDQTIMQKIDKEIKETTLGEASLLAKKKNLKDII